jgi:hypothetical protein
LLNRDYACLGLHVCVLFLHTSMLDRYGFIWPIALDFELHMSLFPCGKLACNYFMGFLFHYGFLAVLFFFLELMLFFTLHSRMALRHPV